eukprot:9836945-Lingulodinium_polyedra.AAC.1
MWSNRPRAAATARQTHARALHADNNCCCTHGVRKRAIGGGGRSVGAAWMLLGCCFSAAWVLLGCCFGAAW